jgi:hypothetical protein
VPPPPSRFPTGSTITPADVPPSLTAPRGSLGVPSGGTIIPGTSLPRSPSLVPPAGSFQVDPPAGSGFGGGGALQPGLNYAPASEALTSAVTPAAQTPENRQRAEITGPSLKPPTTTTSPITAPALHPSIQPVPDPEAHQPPRPVNRAPQLLDPRDKTARNDDQRWAVVPAVWPTQVRAQSTPTLGAERSPYRVFEERSLSTSAMSKESQYDDGGWTSSR